MIEKEFQKQMVELKQVCPTFSIGERMEIAETSYTWIVSMGNMPNGEFIVEMRHNTNMVLRSTRVIDKCQDMVLAIKLRENEWAFKKLDADNRIVGQIDSLEESVKIVLRETIRMMGEKYTV